MVRASAFSPQKNFKGRLVLVREFLFPVKLSRSFLWVERSQPLWLCFTPSLCTQCTKPQGTPVKAVSVCAHIYGGSDVNQSPANPPTCKVSHLPLPNQHNDHSIQSLVVLGSGSMQGLVNGQSKKASLQLLANRMTLVIWSSLCIPEQSAARF